MAREGGCGSGRLARCGSAMHVHHGNPRVRPVTHRGAVGGLCAGRVAARQCMRLCGAGLNCRGGVRETRITRHGQAERAEVRVGVCGTRHCGFLSRYPELQSHLVLVTWLPGPTKHSRRYASADRGHAPHASARPWRKAGGETRMHAPQHSTQHGAAQLARCAGGPSEALRREQLVCRREALRRAWGVGGGGRSKCGLAASE